MLNLDKMKEKQAILEGKKQTTGKKAWFWKPQDGENVVRILPDSDGDPFKEAWVHYNLGNIPGFGCPKRTSNDPCAVCDFVTKLYQSKDEDDKKLAGTIKARQRFFSVVVDRNEEVEAPKVWSYSKTVYQVLLNYVLNPDYGDITDADDGTDLVLEYGKKNGASFPSTTITPRRKSSPLSKSKDKIKELLNTEVPFDQLFEVKTSVEVEALFKLYREGGTEEASSETRKYSEEDDVDAAFAELTQTAA